ncbi:unnamed protein product [Rotaria sp. Silwood2]|nr:unnamed protein product [Rotaria sp. Silwood2]CAF4358309.1 unnamed protein product [Rotaria sp. Silwood2]
MYHLWLLITVDRWLQQLLSEFLQQRDHFKYKLKEKWDKQELFINAENNNKTRKLYFTVKELQKAVDEILSRSSFEKMNDYITKFDCQNGNIGELKETFNTLIEKYFKILDHYNK